MNKRAEQDVVYLNRVLNAWRGAFADAESDNMPELYEAGFRRGRENDWSQLRPLLLVLRTILRINDQWISQIAFGLQLSSDPAADAETARELHRLTLRLAEAAEALQDVLDATRPVPGQPDGYGAGKPREPVTAVDPSRGGLRGLVDIGLLAGTTVLGSAGIGAMATVQGARLWWRGRPEQDSATRAVE